MSTHIIYLAAGSSRRFGANKLLYELDGTPLFRYGLNMLAGLVRARTDCTLTVVSRYAEILQAARAEGARAVPSPESEKGLSYTIRAALSALEPLDERDFLAFVTADQPYLSVQTAARLLDAAAPGVCCATTAYAGRAGSPTLFSAALAPELRALTGDQGGRRVLLRHECVTVQACSERELMDIDTKACIADEFRHE